MSLELFSLTGRVAVVMGGTSGIGREISVGLAAAGADVVATGRREQLVHEAANAIEQLGRKALRLTVDAGDRQSIDRLRDAVLQQLGRVDILVNSAGQIFRKPSVDIAEDEWSKLLDINLTGTLRACQSFYHRQHCLAQFLCQPSRNHCLRRLQIRSARPHSEPCRRMGIQRNQCQRNCPRRVSYRTEFGFARWH